MAEHSSLIALLGVNVFVVRVLLSNEEALLVWIIELIPVCLY